MKNFLKIGSSFERTEDIVIPIAKIIIFNRKNTWHRDYISGDYVNSTEFKNLLLIIGDTNSWPQLRKILLWQVLRSFIAYFNCFWCCIMIGDLATSLSTISSPRYYLIFVAFKFYYALAPVVLIAGFLPHLVDIAFIRRWDQLWKDSHLNRTDKFRFGQSADAPNSPRKAKYLLWVLTPGSFVVRRDAVSDLDDQFDLKCSELGVRLAKRWYWKEVFKSARDAIWLLVGKVGLAFFLDWVKRLL
jgi:hypothetical protein